MDHPLFNSNKPLIRIVKSLPKVEQQTLRHIYHVEKRALRISRVFSLNSIESAVVKFAARMHDIAKFLSEFRPLFFEHIGRFDLAEKQQASLHAFASAVVTVKLFDQGSLNEDLDIVAPGIFAIAGHHWPYCESEERYRKILSEMQFVEFAGFAQPRYGDFPLEVARLLKVADYFEARIENRHYLGNQRPLTPREALEEIESKAGEEFDPMFVSALREDLALRPTQT